MIEDCLRLVRLVEWYAPSEFAPVDLNQNRLFALGSLWKFTDWDWLIDAEVVERNYALDLISKPARSKSRFHSNTEHKSAAKEYDKRSGFMLPITLMIHRIMAP